MNRRRDDQPLDLEQFRAAGWFWVGYLAALAFGLYLVAGKP